MKIRNNKWLVVCFIFVLAACNPKVNNNIINLRCENLVNPEGINTVFPRFSWKTHVLAQQSYQILVASAPDLLSTEQADLWDSGKVNSPSGVLIPYHGNDLSSRSLGFWKVCVWDEAGNSCWSETASFSVGLLAKSDWQASYIALPVEAGNIESPLLRKSFEWEGADAAKLHVNSLGYHEVWMNGKKVTDAVLTPAVSQLDKRSLSNTYDLLPYLHKGKNELVLWLGQGWYRPWLPGGQYEGPVVRAQIDVSKNRKWETFLTTNVSWIGRSSGYSSIGSWRRGAFGGEKVDASQLLDDLSAESLIKAAWHAVIEVDVPEHEVTPQTSEYNRIKEIIRPVSITRIADSTVLVDMGKNFTGWVEIKFPQLSEGQEILMEYFDFKDQLIQARQSDCYISSGKPKEVFCNKFNYHGFRYIKLSQLHIDPKPEDIKAYFIQEDFQTASSFACSDNDMNAIHDMIQYTIRCLSLGGYVVDCPHLERLGYGGDGNASTLTAQTMFDMSPLYSNWLQAWTDCMQEDGGMPHTAPNPYRSGGGPYWCGFIVLASWNTYVQYGDIQLLKQHYASMRKWFEYVEKYSPDGLLQAWPNNDYRNWYLGDWAVPEGIEQKEEASVNLVNNCAIIQCYDAMEKIAQVLNQSDDAIFYSERKKRLQKLVHQKFFDSDRNRYATSTPIDLSYPLLIKATPDSLIEKVTERLFWDIRVNRNGHMSCGLVGVSILTELLTYAGHKDLMYQMLKKRGYPGFLYMIDQGGTTTWEHWNGSRSHIHNCYNGIGSWFYQAIGGILPNEDYPAYQRFFIQPQVPDGVTWAKVTKETPYGGIIVHWKLIARTLEVDVQVPWGSTALFVLPEGVNEYTIDGKSMKLSGNEVSFPIEGGNYSISYSVN